MSAMTGGERPPTPAFQRAFIFSGSMRVQCDFCGRTHFANNENAGDWEPGELEKLRDEEERDPGLVMGWDCDSIGRGVIDGREFAEGCPCRSIWPFERWIWHHRNEIANYIAARVTLEARRTKSEAQELVMAKNLMDQDWAVRRLQEVIENVRDSKCVDEPIGMGDEGKVEWCEPDVHGWRYKDHVERWVHFGPEGETE